MDNNIHQLAYLYAHQQEIAEEFGINKSVTERDLFMKESKRRKRNNKVNRNEEKKRI